MVLKQKNRNLIIGLGVALVIAVLVILFLLLNNRNSKYQKMPRGMEKVMIEEPSPRRIVKDERVPSLVLFYANWCGHSQNFLDVWSQLLSQNLKCDMIGLEEKENHKDIEVNSISGFPTVRLYPNGYTPASQDYIEYNGNRSLESLIDFVKSEGNTAL